MADSLLLYFVLILLALSPLLAWLNLPARGALSLAILGTKIVVALGWWLLLGLFVYFNFIVGNLNPRNEMLTFFVLFLIGYSPVLFWLNFPSHSVQAKMLVGFKLVASCIWATALGIVFYFSFLFSPLDFVEDEIVSQQGSPDGAYTVAVVNRYGGATVSNATVVVIGSKNFMFETNHAQILFEMNGIKKVTLAWVGANQLTIQHEPGTIYTQLPQWKDVSIKYIPKWHAATTSAGINAAD